MVYCSALNCQNATSGVYKNSAVTFYGFPLKNQPLLKQWIHNMGRDMGTPSRHQRLCSKHFEDSSFEIDPLKIRKYRRLQKEAVPKKFILGEDGNWLVGTPRSFCGKKNNKIRKRIRNPEHSRVPGTLDNAAARKRKNLEDRQKGLHKKAVKKKHESLTTLGKDRPVPKSKPQTTEALHVTDQQDFEGRAISGRRGTAITSKSRSQAEASENTEPRGSFSGGSRDPAGQISDKGVTPKSLRRSATDPANPTRGRRGHGSLEERETNEFKEVLFNQQNRAGEGLYLCTECQKTFKLKIELQKHKEIHTKKSQVPSYICTECGNSFGRYADLIRHKRAQTGQRPYQCTECEKSFMEKPRLANHLRTHNIYM